MQTKWQAMGKGTWARWGLAATLCGMMAWQSAQAEPVKVVTSFSILADMVQEVGGDQVKVTSLVGANQDAHGFEPRPGDARRLGEANLLVINGLAFETWIDGLVQASGFKGNTVVASAGVKALRSQDDDHDEHDAAHQDEPGHGHGHGHGHADAHAAADSHGHAHGEFDPHAWQNLSNGVLYVRNIERALVAADPAHAELYRQRADAYVTRLRALDTELKSAFAALPAERRKAVVSHDALNYFSDAYGLVLLPVAGQSTAAEPSAAEMARLIRQIRDEKIQAVFIENVSRSQLADQIARETGARVGGLLLTDALAEPGQRGATYLDMMQWNGQQFLEAMAP